MMTAQGRTFALNRNTHSSTHLHSKACRHNRRRSKIPVPNDRTGSRMVRSDS